MLPGDFNDDGVVNSQDLAGIRNEWLGIGGAKPTIFGDINGDGMVNVVDYNAERLLIGTSLPAMSDAIDGRGREGARMVRRRCGSAQMARHRASAATEPARVPRFNCPGEDGAWRTLARAR